MKHTILRLSAYTENFLSFFVPRRGEDGKLSLTIPLEGQLSLFSVADLGRAVATVLSNPDAHSGKAYGLASEWLTGAEIAALLGKVVGEPVAYYPVPVAVFKTFPFPGASDIGNMFAFYERRDLYSRSVAETAALIPGGPTSAEATLTANGDALRAAVKA